MCFGVKERILTLRLMEKARANPACARALGIVVANPVSDPGSSSVSLPAGSKP